MKQIKTREAYLNRKQDLKTLEEALESRRFEIDLYWRRTTYFWGLIAAAFAGYFAVDATHEKVLLAGIGVVLSEAWYLANRGSKYWQENWERHVDVLEDEHIGSLFKTTIAREQFKWRKPLDGYPYSVSKLNQLVSLYIVAIWLVLLCSAILALFRCDTIPHALVVAALGACSVIYLGVLAYFGRSRSEGKARPVDFVQVSLEATPEDSSS